MFPQCNFNSANRLRDACLCLRFTKLFLIMDTVFFVKLLDEPNESFGQAGFEVLAFFDAGDTRGVDECYRYFRNECKEFSLHVCRLNPDESGRYVMNDNQLLFARLKHRSTIHARNHKLKEKMELDYFIKTGKLL